MGLCLNLLAILKVILGFIVRLYRCWFNRWWNEYFSIGFWLIQKAIDIISIIMFLNSKLPKHTIIKFPGLRSLWLRILSAYLLVPMKLAVWALTRMINTHASKGSSWFLLFFSQTKKTRQKKRDLYVETKWFFIGFPMFTRESVEISSVSITQLQCYSVITVYTWETTNQA